MGKGFGGDVVVSQTPGTEKGIPDETNETTTLQGEHAK